MMAKNDIWLLPLLLCALLLSCGPKQDDKKQVFRYNETTGIASLDPAFAKNQSVIWPVHQVFNTLVETDSNLNIVPSLAYRWDVSADRLTYVFHLRNDVSFHDNEAFAQGRGRKMTAHDVVYSYRRIIDPATASSGAWIFNNIECFQCIGRFNFSIEIIAAVQSYSWVT